MRYAHVGKTRVEAYRKGKATCNVCGGELYAACGEIQIWHWRHEVLDCDPWYGNMTDWHIEWQNRFPEQWREIVIIKDDVKHIADIKTINDKVIEFQHSPLTSIEIKKREEFYKDMLWVIDARGFKDNLKIYSIVNSLLRNTKQYKEVEKEEAKRCLLDSIESTKNRIRELNREIEKTPSDISIIELKLKAYNSIKLDVKAFTKEKLMESWLDKRYYNDYKIDDLINSIERQFRNQIISIVDNKWSLNAEMRDISKKLKLYEELEILKIENMEYKIVDYCQLRSKGFEKIKAIRKHSLLTKYPDIKQIESECEFEDYEDKKDKYYFSVDLSKSIPKFFDDITEIAQYLDLEERNLLQTERDIQIGVDEELDTLIQSENKAIKELNDQLAYKLENLDYCKSNLIEKEENFDSELETILRDIDEKYQKEDGQIMRENKGKYTFTWKHERKSWRAASSPILFDVGEEYLFLIEGEDRLRKVPIVTFMNRLTQNK